MVLVNTKHKLPSNLSAALIHILIGFASRLWVKLMPGGIQRRVDDISKQFTGAGWKHLPQELVDEVLGYLLDDQDALRACSLTCKHLFGATRPLIHQWLCLPILLPPTAYPKPKRSPDLIRRHRGKRGPETFEWWIDTDRPGLRYTQHLTFTMRSCTFCPRDMQEHLPYLRSITKLHGLTIIAPEVHQFIPVFGEYFGMFTSTLRYLHVRNSYCAEQQLLYIICQFPLLEDLSIASPRDLVACRGHPVPTITQSPPLRGKLVLWKIHSREFSEGLAAFPGGLNFRSLELFQCGSPRAVLAACSHTVTSISYLWDTWGSEDSELNLLSTWVLRCNHRGP